MELIQSVYILLLSPIGKINNRISDTFRDIVIYICTIVLFGDIIIGHTNTNLMPKNSLFLSIISIGDVGRSIIALVLLIVILFASVKDNLKHIQWKWYLIALWFLGSTLIIITGLFHNIGAGYLVNQLLIVLVFPAIYYVWQNNMDAERFLAIICKAIITVVLIYAFVCMAFYPYETLTISGIRYFATTNNPNTLALFSITGVIASLYLISCQISTLHGLFYMIALGFSYGLLILSLSRTSLIASLLASLAFLIMWFKMKKPAKLLIAAILIACIAFAAFYVINCRGVDVFGLTSAGSMSYATDESLNDSSEESSLIDRFNSFQNANQYSAGRVGIWKIYLAHVTYSGNDVSYNLPIRVVSYDGTGINYFSSAHNCALEIAYRSGWPSGIIFFILEVLALLFAFKLLLSNRNGLKNHHVLTVMAIIAFVAVSLFESINLPTARELTLLFYFSLIPFFMDEKAGDTDAQ